MDSRFINKKVQNNGTGIWGTGLLVLLICITIFIISMVNRRNQAYQETAEHASMSVGSEEPLELIMQDLESYTEETAELSYHLEVFEVDSNIVTLSGWIVNHSDLTANGHIFIYANNLFFPCQILLREDVAEYYETPAYEKSGFLCEIDTSKWISQEYPISICLANSEEHILYKLEIPDTLRLQ